MIGKVFFKETGIKYSPEVWDNYEVKVPHVSRGLERGCSVSWTMESYLKFVQSRKNLLFVDKAKKRVAIFPFELVARHIEDNVAKGTKEPLKVFKAKPFFMDKLYLELVNMEISNG